MMRYVIEQRLFSRGNHFVIKTEAGQVAFQMDGKANNNGHRYSFKDPQDHELAYIFYKTSAHGPVCEIYRQGELFAVIKKHRFSLFRCRFTVDVPGPDDLEASGNFLDNEYTFTRAQKIVATVSRTWLSPAGTYSIEIAEGEDAVLILACASVLDLICHSD